MKNPYAKIRHRAGKMNDKSEVSALCFTRPHAIDLSRATYTIYGEPNCPRCKRIIAALAARTPDERGDTDGVDFGSDIRAALAATRSQP